MPTPKKSVSVYEVERVVLRKAWWTFPAAGAVAALAWGGPFWRWVEGSRPWPIPWGDMISVRALALAGAFSLIPLIWRAGLRVRGRPGMAAALAVAMTLGAEVLLRSGTIQIPLWLASRARLDPGQSFMREVCYVRLEEVSGRKATEPAIILVGSSQMLHGVDEKLLRELVAPVPVIRRSMFGLTPLKAVAMMDYIPFQRGDVCVQYLSEFDFTNQEEFPHSWFRPYASRGTFPAVMQCVDDEVKMRHWGRVIDYLLASWLECWRSRDFLRQLAFHFWGAGPGARKSERADGEALALQERAQGDLTFSAAEWRAFTRFSRELSAMGVRQWIFEGDVNPALYSPARMEAKAGVRAELSGLAEKQGHRYISRVEQGLDFGPGLWRDMTHLNQEGRYLLTRKMAEELKRP